MPYYGKLLKSKMAHDLYLVERHTALRVVGVILAIRRFASVAIATQVGSHYGEFPGQPRCDFVPHDVCLRVAVQEQQRRTFAARNYMDSCARGLDFRDPESIKHAGTCACGWLRLSLQQGCHGGSSEDSSGPFQETTPVAVAESVVYVGSQAS